MAHDTHLPDIDRINRIYEQKSAAHSAAVSNAKARAAFARWGNSHAVEPRGQVAVSRSLVDEFFRVYPPELRRAGADYGIRKAIDDAASVKAFHAQVSKEDK